jgi:hypothetical protein
LLAHRYHILGLEEEMQNTNSLASQNRFHPVYVANRFYHWKGVHWQNLARLLSPP